MLTEMEIPVGQGTVVKSVSSTPVKSIGEIFITNQEATIIPVRLANEEYYVLCWLQNRRIDSVYDLLQTISFYGAEFPQDVVKKSVYMPKIVGGRNQDFVIVGQDEIGGYRIPLSIDKLEDGEAISVERR